MRIERRVEGVAPELKTAQEVSSLLETWEVSSLLETWEKKERRADGIWVQWCGPFGGTVSLRAWNEVGRLSGGDERRVLAFDRSHLLEHSEGGKSVFEQVLEEGSRQFGFPKDRVFVVHLGSSAAGQVTEGAIDWLTELRRGGLDGGNDLVMIGYSPALPSQDIRVREGVKLCRAAPYSAEEVEQIFDLEPALAEEVAAKTGGFAELAAGLAREAKEKGRVLNRDFDALVDGYFVRLEAVCHLVEPRKTLYLLDLCPGLMGYPGLAARLLACLGGTNDPPWRQDPEKWWMRQRKQLFDLGLLLDRDERNTLVLTREVAVPLGDYFRRHPESSRTRRGELEKEIQAYFASLGGR